MGEAKTRGSEQQRREQAVGEVIENAEVLICLSSSDKKVRVAIIPRDEQPDGESLAVILAGFINANFGNLCETALQAKRDFEAAQAAGQPNPQFIKQRPVRSVTRPDGGLAKDGPVIVGPDGKQLQ